MIWRLREGEALRYGLNVEWVGWRRGVAFVLFWRTLRNWHSARIRFFASWRRPRVGHMASCMYCDVLRDIACRACSDDKLARIPARTA